MIRTIDLPPGAQNLWPLGWMSAPLIPYSNPASEPLYLAYSVRPTAQSESTDTPTRPSESESSNNPTLSMETTYQSKVGLLPNQIGAH